VGVLSLVNMHVGDDVEISGRCVSAAREKRERRLMLKESAWEAIIEDSVGWREIGVSMVLYSIAFIRPKRDRVA
jgi:hypothetical protein